MAGMTAMIAGMIRDGSLTLTECAERLGLTREQLDSRLALMERQGYLSQMRPAAAEDGCSCGHCCATCNKSKDAPAPVLYTLTQKGERLAQDTGGS